MTQQIVDDGEYGGEEYEEQEAGADGSYEAPEGFETVSQDVAGYWDPKLSGPMTWRPRAVRLVDNTQEANKSSCLIFGELLAPAKLQKNAQKKDDRTFEVFPAGTSVGVWGKAGMRDLLELGGATVWTAPNGFRQLEGRDKPMALFHNKRKTDGPKGEKLTLVSDARDKSLLEPLSDSAPWWLQVLPDGGVAKAEATMGERVAKKRGAKTN